MKTEPLLIAIARSLLACGGVFLLAYLVGHPIQDPYRDVMLILAVIIGTIDARSRVSPL